MASLSQRALAEVIGTFALVFVGAGAIVVGQARFALGAGHGDLLAIALAHGLTIFVMVNALGHVSGGHFNPAVTFGLFVSRKVGGREMAAYWLAQLVGAAFGALAVVAVTKGWADGPRTSTHIGIPGPGTGIPVAAVLVTEVLLTFFLVLVVHGTIDARSQARVGGLAIGMTVALDILVGGPISGAAMNPARWFGPALVSNFWDGGWMYVVAPLFGGALAGGVYGSMLEKEPSAVGRAGG